jgi:hypothetical protein
MEQVGLVVKSEKLVGPNLGGGTDYPYWGVLVTLLSLSRQILRSYFNQDTAASFQILSDL